MTLFEQFQQVQRDFFGSLEVSAAALRARIADLEVELASRDVDVADLEAEVARLNELLAAQQSPWEPLYSTTFATNDGWKMRDETQGNDASRNVPRNAVFGDGLRVLFKRERTGSGDSQRDFTTADVLGQHVAIPNYFRARVVGRAPHEAGLWPCVLWFRPLNGSDGEIDVMENFGGQPRVKATLHSAYANRKMIGRNLRWDTFTTDPAGYHEYVIEKTPGRILITVDGAVLMDVGPASPGDDVAAFPWDNIFENPDRTWYPRITGQAGCGKDNPTCATGFPPASFTQADMHVRSLEIDAWRGRGSPADTLDPWLNRC